MRIKQIVNKFASCLADAVREREARFASALSGAAQAAAAWAVAEASQRTVVCVADGPQSLETLHRDLLTLSPTPGRGTTVLLYYPAWEALPNQNARQDNDIVGCRLDTLIALAPLSQQRPGHPLIATCAQALMQKAASPDRLVSATLQLSIEDELELQDVAAALSKSGYEFVAQVEEKGHAAARGGLLDVWPTNATHPVRMEFFGSTIASIRSFDPRDQRSRDKLAMTTIPPADEWGLIQTDKGDASFLDYIPDDSVFVWPDMEAAKARASAYEEAIGDSDDKAVALHFESLLARIASKKTASRLFFGVPSPESRKILDMDIEPIRTVVSISGDVFQPDMAEKARHDLLEDLRKRARGGHTVVIFLDTPSSREHFENYIAAQSSEQPGPARARSRRITTMTGVLSAGFISDAMKLAVIAESDLYGRRKRSTWRYQPGAGTPLREGTSIRVADLSEIEPGDLVVHVEHGIGRYLGVREILFNGQVQETLTIEYADDAKLHVPVSHAHLLSKYVGSSANHAVELHRLGGARWANQKAAAEHAIVDLAASLLQTQAERRLLKGHAFASDTQWQHEFEASFPYRETPDQENAIIAVRNDMEAHRPMDRLVCGDAGYGKTEVAMRAAFKTVMNRKQAAVLVPTTVLAQQHFDTFRDRMSAYPIRIEMLSRFCGRKQHAEIIKGMADGTVDIVIGTHCLLQPGIRFKDLGLAVIDEEQRFGVLHKERLKNLRRLVDVLTLTATPIPRTLYLSLTGARDMSLILTPPSERMDIETIVAKNTDSVVREAILREINREGQVFYLHNRIMTIDLVRQRLARIVPEARVKIAHGRMASHELAGVVKEFVSGALDVLLCTTIIESGIDIPRANTILIDRADRFGIADLYQLRGRVGRSSHKAYAYLLLPARGEIDSDARKRIGAVRKHASRGAAFHLALRDLEIRGAGNILGAEQSGHIAAVGFGLYCQLLKGTIARLKGAPAPKIVDAQVNLDFINLSPQSASDENAAVIPYTYIEDEPLRLSAYGKTAEAASLDDLAALGSELSDRFGPIPKPVERLLKIAELRIVSATQRITKVETRSDKVMFARGAEYLKKGAYFPRLTAQTADGRLDEIIALAQTADQWSAA